MEKFITTENYGLLIDVSTLTTAQKYLETNKEKKVSTFDLLVPKLGKKKYLVIAGIEDALSFILNVSFPKEYLNYLKQQGFSEELLNYLKKYKFTGDVWALPEGDITGANKPIMRVHAPIIESEIIKTYLINCVSLQTSLASKTSRVNDFNLDTSLQAARSNYIAGAKCTSNILAGAVYNIPLCKTKSAKKNKKQKLEPNLDMIYKVTKKRKSGPPLKQMIRKGKLIILFPSLDQIRSRVKKNIAGVRNTPSSAKAPAGKKTRKKKKSRK